VSISTFNAMGALLVSLAPSFCAGADRDLQQGDGPPRGSSNTSITIMAWFTFLSHFSGF
jgi:hypothetical protein